MSDGYRFALRDGEGLELRGRLVVTSDWPTEHEVALLEAFAGMLQTLCAPWGVTAQLSALKPETGVHERIEASDVAHELDHGDTREAAS